MAVMIGGVPHITIAEAASRLHTTQLRLLMLLKKGAMKGCEIDGEWFIETDSLSCFERYEAGAGEKKGCPSSCDGCSGK